ncbi:MAG TPA: SusD family outer membrane lipoprotein NanU [Flavitalea sp.]|nr:SusD family outer membrane lipoprotein NanU [Flavitalea sp.]
MKAIYRIIFIVQVASALTACNKLSLDLAPVSQIADGNYWQSKGHFESFINGIHSRMRTHEYTFFLLGSIRGDEYGDAPFGGESFGGLERYWLNTLNEENAGITNFGELYTNINQINLFINKGLSTNILDEADRNYYLGQAYGMRAFYYFHLLRSWGGVIIWDEPSMSFDVNNLAKPAASASDVMDFIKSDLESSVTHFGGNYTFKSNRKTFWSKAATLMLKAEAYLWSSKQFGGGSADAAIAKNALMDIQQNIPSLGLLPDFGEVFSYENKNNREMIFTIFHELDEAAFMNGNLNNSLPQASYFESFYDSLQDRSFSRAVDLLQESQRGLTTAVTKKTYWSFDSEDGRKFGSIQGAYTKDGGVYNLAGCYLSKYQGVNIAGVRRLIDDYPVYRYADLLLMLAEAKAVLGEDITAEINLVRARAYAGNYNESTHGYPNQPGDDDINETLLRERLFEFIGEGKRWYDILRFGKEYVFKYTTAKQDHLLLWPIDINTLTRNRALQQNPGY